MAKELTITQNELLTDLKQKIFPVIQKRFENISLDDIQEQFSEIPSFYELQTFLKSAYDKFTDIPFLDLSKIEERFLLVMVAELTDYFEKDKEV